MTMHDPYKRKRSRFDDIVMTTSDEISLNKVFENGKWKTVDDVVLTMNNSWNRLPPRSILTRLFNGTTKYDELIEHYKNAAETEEMMLAQKENRNPKQPFQFNDAREKFLKEINELKILGFVIQGGTEFTTEPRSISYTLTDEGVLFVKQNIVATIENENLDVFMVLLNKEKKRVFYANFLMKIAEMRGTKFDQLLLLIDDLESKDKQNAATGQDIMREYVRYLAEIEEEPVKPHDAPIIYADVMKKLSQLVSSGLIELRDGMYFLTKQGTMESNAFTGTILNTIDFLSKAGLLLVEEIEQGPSTGRYVIMLKPEGLAIASEIKEVFENDENRIIEQGVLDDFDLHETKAVLPIDLQLEKEKEIKKERNLSIYIVPKYKLSLKERIWNNVSAVVMSMALLFVMLLVVGFFMIASNDPATGFSVIIVSIIGLMISACAYPASVEWIKRAQSKPERAIIEEQFDKRKNINQDIVKKMTKNVLKNKKIMFFIVMLVTGLVLMYLNEIASGVAFVIIALLGMLVSSENVLRNVIKRMKEKKSI